MAIAGRVAIVPQGNYEPGRTYKRLDMVLYDGNGYVAKKEATGKLPTDEEFWMKSTEGAVTKVATTEQAGIVKPDGVTITVAEDGTITGASTEFVGTMAEYEAAAAAGEIEDGTIVNITDDYSEIVYGDVDAELSDLSENPVQNKIITEKINELNGLINEVKQLKASLEQYGMVRLSSSNAVTDSTGLALPATEKNPNVEGSMAESLSHAVKDNASSTLYGKYNMYGSEYTDDMINELAKLPLLITSTNIGGKIGYPAIGFYFGPANWNVLKSDIYNRPEWIRGGHDIQKIAFLSDIPTEQSIAESVIEQISEQYNLERKTT